MVVVHKFADHLQNTPVFDGSGPGFGPPRAVQLYFSGKICFSLSFRELLESGLLLVAKTLLEKCGKAEGDQEADGYYAKYKSAAFQACLEILGKGGVELRIFDGVALALYDHRSSRN